MVNCENERCKHNKNQACILSNIYIIDDSCVSRRKKPPDENYTKLMRVGNEIAEI